MHYKRFFSCVILNNFMNLYIFLYSVSKIWNVLFFYNFSALIKQKTDDSNDDLILKKCWLANIFQIAIRSSLSWKLHMSVIDNPFFPYICFPYICRLPFILYVTIPDLCKYSQMYFAPIKNRMTTSSLYIQVV